MRVAELIVASVILTASGAGVALAQFVDPLRALEESRRERLEMDKRLAREAAARRLREKAEQAAQADAQRKLEKERAALVIGAPAANTPSTQFEASAREVVPGTTIPITSAANATSGTVDLIQPGAPSARDAAAGTALAGSTINAANGIPLSNQTEAPSVHEGAPGASLPTAPAPSAAIEIPAANQPIDPSGRDAVAAAPVPTPPRVLITVDKAAQQMRVTVDGKLRYSWAVSTGRAHYETPTGTFRPLYLARKHYSKEWDGAPMPHSIFFTDRGHAIHASNATRSLGRRASHGCVRLAPSKAAMLFALVQAEGVSATKVTITNGASLGKAAQLRTGDARARKRAHVRRASSDFGQIGPRVGWTE